MNTADSAFMQTLMDHGYTPDAALTLLKLAYFRDALETSPAFARAFDERFVKLAQLGGGLAEWAGQMKARFQQGVQKQLAPAAPAQPAPAAPAQPASATPFKPVTPAAPAVPAPVQPNPGGFNPSSGGTADPGPAAAPAAPAAPAPAAAPQFGIPEGALEKTDAGRQKLMNWLWADGNAEQQKLRKSYYDSYNNLTQAQELSQHENALRAMDLARQQQQIDAARAREERLNRLPQATLGFGNGAGNRNALAQFAGRYARGSLYVDGPEARAREWDGNIPR